MNAPDSTAEIERLQEEADLIKRAELAGKATEAIDKLDFYIRRLTAMGVAVSISLEAPVTRPLDKIEQPGSVKAPGWYAYVDFMDEEGTRRHIDAARRAVLYSQTSLPPTSPLDGA